MNELEAERERGLEALTRAYTSDAISVSDFERRAGLVQQARDGASIREIVADLPVEAPGARPLSNSGRPSPLSQRTDPSLSGSQSVACVMGDRHMQGDWLSGDRVQSFTLMGSTKLDLREVILPPGGLRIDLSVVMGETVVVVPRGLAVRLGAFPFMGEASAARDVAQRAAPGEPVVAIEGFAFMGSIRVIAAD
ncbi:MAG TPA: LiaF domain-containing protein [Rectinemataceae bacterium]|nr:LiaF domain-containing protein [Rectinemataceae bacterium]